ncbi:MAG: hypothetical protein IJ622_01760 [Bacteroidales bacterium]|nr:hypothetical protein [Bacteroidales bacterium]
MKERIISVLKTITLVASWLTLSPLLLILDGRWKLLPKWLRIMFFVLSPMMLMVLALAAFWCHDYYFEHYLQHHFSRRRVIENITGVRLPRYKVVDRGEDWKCFGRFPEHAYDFTLEFRKMPDEDFYENLDEHFDCFEPGKYSFSTIWGNGLEAPKGESDDDDISFSIDVERGSKTFHIRVMEW